MSGQRDLCKDSSLGLRLQFNCPSPAASRSAHPAVEAGVVCGGCDPDKAIVFGATLGWIEWSKLVETPAFKHSDQVDIDEVVPC